MNNENPKIPCGGFRIGDGLTMDGDTLKSLGGAFVLFNIRAEVLTVRDDSPIKTYEEIRTNLRAGVPIKAMAWTGGSWLVFDTQINDRIDSVWVYIFERTFIGYDKLTLQTATVNPSDEWEYKSTIYALTPIT